MKFEFPSQIFLSQATFSLRIQLSVFFSGEPVTAGNTLANNQVKRSFGNGGSLRDDPNNGCKGDYRNLLFLSPRTPSCPLFCHLGNPALIFFK